jgi:hypothetical protein
LLIEKGDQSCSFWPGFIVMASTLGLQIIVKFISDAVSICSKSAFARADMAATAFQKPGIQFARKLFFRNMGMSLALKTCLIVAFSLSLSHAPALAQSVQFVPETDIHLKLNSVMRAYLQAKDDRDEGASDQFSIGPSIQLYLKPLIHLQRITTFDLDDSKPKFLVLETGYRSVTAPNALPINRMEDLLTFHIPVRAGFLITDRNRADLDWTSATFTWRYRNKLTLERTFAINSYHLIPYLAAEPYYVDKYHKWSTTDLYAGCLFPVGKYIQLNPYYEHENNTGKPPNQQTNYIGLAVYFFFSMPKN